jgi:hypothetical protein
VALRVAEEAAAMLPHTRAGPAQLAATALQLGRALAASPAQQSAALATLRRAATIAAGELGCARPEARAALLSAAAVHIQCGAAVAALHCLRAARGIAELRDMLRLQPETLSQGLGAPPQWAVAAISAADAVGHMSGAGVNDGMRIALALRLYVTLCEPAPPGSLKSAAEGSLQGASLYSALVGANAKIPIVCTLPDGAFKVTSSDEKDPDVADLGSLTVQWLMEARGTAPEPAAPDEKRPPQPTTLPSPVTTESILNLPYLEASARLLFVACVVEEAAGVSAPAPEVPVPAVKRVAAAKTPAKVAPGGAHPVESPMQQTGRWHWGTIDLPARSVRTLASRVRALRVALEQQESGEEHTPHSSTHEDGMQVCQCCSVADLLARLYFDRVLRRLPSILDNGGKNGDAVACSVCVSSPSCLKHGACLDCCSWLCWKFLLNVYRVGIGGTKLHFGMHMYIIGVHFLYDMCILVCTFYWYVRFGVHF